jgi:hypothetical protein
MGTWPLNSLEEPMLIVEAVYGLFINRSKADGMDLIFNLLQFEISPL